MGVIFFIGFYHNAIWLPDWRRNCYRVFFIGLIGWGFCIFFRSWIPPQLFWIYERYATSPILIETLKPLKTGNDPLTWYNVMSSGKSTFSASMRHWGCGIYRWRLWRIAHPSLSFAGGISPPRDWSEGWTLRAHAPPPCNVFFSTEYPHRIHSCSILDDQFL